MVQCETTLCISTTVLGWTLITKHLTHCIVGLQKINLLKGKSIRPRANTTHRFTSSNMYTKYSVSPVVSQKKCNTIVSKYRQNKKRYAVEMRRTILIHCRHIIYAYAHSYNCSTTIAHYDYDKANTYFLCCIYKVKFGAEYLWPFEVL